MLYQQSSYCITCSINMENAMVKLKCLKLIFSFTEMLDHVFVCVHGEIKELIIL